MQFASAAWLITDSVSVLSSLLDSLLAAAASLVNLIAVSHALTPADRELAALFGEHTGDDIDKVERCSWREGPYGLPVLDGPRAWRMISVLRPAP